MSLVETKITNHELNYFFFSFTFREKRLERMQRAWLEVSTFNPNHRL